MTQEGSPSSAKSTRPLGLALAALGVVYGDIGTSPLYAIKLCFTGPHGMSPSADNILGVLSLIFWSITLVVGVKYLFFIMRADNHGEGGILALLALVSANPDRSVRPTGPILILVLFGAALLFGDGIITPAISVLSAVEGLSIATTATEPLIVPLTIFILVCLFVAQRKGTGDIGRVFGIVMLVWFSTLAVLGVFHVVSNPQVFRALNPCRAIEFLFSSGASGFFVLGGVFLTITGAEALYADMGHFGKLPIRIGWFGLVMPSLILNYFGQGSLLLNHPEMVESPFYSMVPRWALYPMVLLATSATVIASQALISGGFSLTRQAIQLGYCPRLTIIHTSRSREGQIYIPEVNWVLMFSCIGLVLSFKSSERLAAAYGVAVTGDMVITSLIFYQVTRKTWRWAWWKSLLLLVGFLSVDFPFLAANSVKFIEGGWVPLLMALFIFTLMTTWKTGRKSLGEHIGALTMPQQDFLKKVSGEQTVRVKGTAVFMTANPNGIPPILIHHWKHNQVLHEQVVLLSVLSENVPSIPGKNRLSVASLGQGFFQVTARYGYMQTPNVPILLQGCSLYGLEIDLDQVTFYLGREHLIPSKMRGMTYWRKILFVLISRNSRSATAYFSIPLEKVVELGMQVEV